MTDYDWIIANSKLFVKETYFNRARAHFALNNRQQGCADLDKSRQMGQQGWEKMYGQFCQ